MISARIIRLPREDFKKLWKECSQLEDAQWNSSRLPILKALPQSTANVVVESFRNESYRTASVFTENEQLSFILNVLDSRFTQTDVEQFRMDSSKRELPLYVFIFPPETQQAYLTFHSKGLLPVGSKTHEVILRAAVKDDEAAAELLLDVGERNLAPSKLLPRLELVANGQRVERETRQKQVADVVVVDELETVPDRQFLVCYRDLPDLEVIRRKQLTVCLIDPSMDSHVRAVSCQQF
uniref:Uncharacterized protein n=1 Tax=Caenorhabditis japonica TaxID=281687 RepID=A0A8R1EFM5_CAEJA